MKYKVELLEGFKLIGFSKEFLSESSFIDIPNYWDEVFLSSSEKIKNIISEYSIGGYGVCIETDNGKKCQYMIAGKYTGGIVPDGLTVFEFPKIMWAKFECEGPIPEALQALSNQIFNDWIIHNLEYQLAEKYNIEWYENGNHCQIWIPVKKK
ncbi:MAG: effector binding domain-containing protein [Anaeroplasmataceae bacterium]|nr:effector binding domain-containing protein [Anaeroplasmataceae bacterium]